MNTNHLTSNPFIDFQKQHKRVIPKIVTENPILR